MFFNISWILSDASMLRTSHRWRRRHALPCAASRWGPAQGGAASRLRPRTPFRRSLLHRFYTRHLAGLSLICRPASRRCSSCSEAVAEGVGSLWEELGDGGGTRWSGRDGGGRRARRSTYPLSCFMAMVLKGARTSITASRHSEPSDTVRRRLGEESAISYCWSSTICLLPPRMLSLSQTQGVRSTYRPPNTVG